MHAFIELKQSKPKKVRNGLFIAENSITFEEEQHLLELLQSKVIEWQDIFAKWGTLNKRRYGWGDSPVDSRNEKNIPEVIENVGEKLYTLFRPYVTNLPEKFTSSIANKYPLGEGLGAHKDGSVWKPFVVGLTLNGNRTMEFTKESGEKIQLLTKRCSAYIFFDDMYTDWYHASLKGKKNGKYYQDSTVFSLTYRTRSNTFASENSHERVQSVLTKNRCIQELFNQDANFPD